MFTLTPAGTSIRVSAESRAVQPGELVVLTIVAPAPATAIRVRAFGGDIAAFGSGNHEWRALVGIDLDVRPGPYRVSVDASPGAGHGSYDLVVEPRRFRTRRLTVDPAF